MKSNLFARCFVAILLVAGFVWALNSSSYAQSGRKPLPPRQLQEHCREGGGIGRYRLSDQIRH
jgi:hypothetical protein